MSTAHQLSHSIKCSWKSNLNSDRTECHSDTASEWSRAKSTTYHLPSLPTVHSTPTHWWDRWYACTMSEDCIGKSLSIAIHLDKAGYISSFTAGAKFSNLQWQKWILVMLLKPRFSFVIVCICNVSHNLVTKFKMWSTFRELMTVYLFGTTNSHCLLAPTLLFLLRYPLAIHLERHHYWQYVIYHLAIHWFFM